MDSIGRHNTFPSRENTSPPPSDSSTTENLGRNLRNQRNLNNSQWNNTNTDASAAYTCGSSNGHCTYFKSSIFSLKKAVFEMAGNYTDVCCFCAPICYAGRIFSGNTWDHFSRTILHPPSNIYWTNLMPLESMPLGNLLSRHLTKSFILRMFGSMWSCNTNYIATCKPYFLLFLAIVVYLLHMNTNTDYPPVFLVHYVL